MHLGLFIFKYSTVLDSLLMVNFLEPGKKLGV